MEMKWTCTTVPVPALIVVKGKTYFYAPDGTIDLPRDEVDSISEIAMERMTAKGEAKEEPIDVVGPDEEG